MAMNVKFLQGTLQQYKNLTNKDLNTFYYVTEQVDGATKYFVYLGTTLLSSGSAVEALQSAINVLNGNENTEGSVDAKIKALKNTLSAVSTSGAASDVSITDAGEKIVATNVEGALSELADSIAANADALMVLNGADSVSGSVANKVKAAKDSIEGTIGSLAGLTTVEKATVVGAINEVKGAVTAAGEAASITVSTETTTGGMLKSYTIYQGGTNKIATIDIPKDLVVESGSVVTDPDASHKGTFIKLVIANQEEPLYINVANLVDVYTAQANASEIQLTFDGYTVSAALVNGGVSTAKIANNAVTTAKIANANITLEKLSQDLQTWKTGVDIALGEGGSVASQIQTAIQALDSSQELTAGTDGLALSVGITDGKITTLTGSIKAGTYDAAGAAANVLGQSSDTSTSNTVYGAKAYAKSYADGLASNYDTAGAASAAQNAAQRYADSLAGNYDAAGTGAEQAASALSDAKAYTDSALTWGTLL